jgi:hypothetical protein
MTGVRNFLLPLVAMTSLAACAPGFEARVARFQQMPAPAQAQTFVIEPRDKENVGGLEFATYANLVRQRLLATGYTEAVTPEQAALTAALQSRAIAGAGLDVYEFEPQVPEALRSLDNVVLLPHLGTAALEVREAMGRMALDNLAAFFAGRDLPNPV